MMLDVTTRVTRPPHISSIRSSLPLKPLDKLSIFQVSVDVFLGLPPFVVSYGCSRGETAFHQALAFD